MTLSDILKRCESTGEFLDEPIQSVNQKGISGDTPLHVVAGWGDVGAIVTLLAAGAVVDARGDLARTPLFAAIGSGSLESVMELVRAGASLGLQDEHGVTPLQCAENLGLREIAAFLRARGE